MGIGWFAKPLPWPLPEPLPEPELLLDGVDAVWFPAEAPQAARISIKSINRKGIAIFFIISPLENLFIT
jgi:hypothetical protein